MSQLDKKVLKQKVTAAIFAHKDEIFSLALSIASEPEMGYKEHKTAAKIAETFKNHNIPYSSDLGITGIKALIKGKTHTHKIAVLGEMDAVTCVDHPMADPITGAAHACGHHGQVAAMAAASIGLKESGVMDELDGDVIPFAVPAEEYVEIEYRNRLRREGKIKYLGGKSELIRLGAFDDIDMAMMIHLSPTGENHRKLYVGGTSNGFIGKMIRFIGREAHAAGAPHEGINALNAAMVALMAVHAQRETFRDEDHVRFHPIITSGGDLVNVVPADVRIESYVRAKTIEAMLDANKKINRALIGGASAIGAEVEIKDLPGYLPLINNEILTKLYKENAAALLGTDSIIPLEHHAASTDMGDLSHIMPVVHPWVGGVSGNLHTRDFKVVDPEMAYLISAQSMAMTIIDLLTDGAACAKQLLQSYKPKMTKKEYLTFMESIS
ncbi:MAG: amidohydrolase [Veillonellales bacterium]